MAHTAPLERQSASRPIAELDSLAITGKPMHSSNLRPEERIAMRDRLRAARYSALADAEGFHEICYAVEALGMRLNRKKGNLGTYKKDVGNLAKHSPLLTSLPDKFPGFFTRFDALYETLRHARNDAMHSGSYARHATSAAVELCIGLEESLMNSAEGKSTVADYMVKSPVLVESWQPVAYARQLMLAHSFSHLPVFYDDQWQLLSELAIACHLHPMNRTDKDNALARSIEDAIKVGLKLLPATTVQPTDQVSELIAASTACPKSTLWLVIEKNNVLTGVLSPFELM